MNLSGVANVNPYRLIDLDQMETSKLSHRLDPWQPVKAERVKPLISHVLIKPRGSPEAGEWGIALNA